MGHYDTCREGYCGICGQAEDADGNCLDKHCKPFTGRRASRNQGLQASRRHAESEAVMTLSEKVKRVLELHDDVMDKWRAFAAKAMSRKDEVERDVSDEARPSLYMEDLKAFELAKIILEQQELLRDAYWALSSYVRYSSAKHPQIHENGGAVLSKIKTALGDV